MLIPLVYQCSLDIAETVVNCYFNTVSLLVSLAIVVKISLFSSLVLFTT